MHLREKPQSQLCKSELKNVSLTLFLKVDFLEPRVA